MISNLGFKSPILIYLYTFGQKLVFSWTTVSYRIRKHELRTTRFRSTFWRGRSFEFWGCNDPLP